MSTHSHDRRVQRTRGLLHESLASLIHEKPYNEIVIKEVLARANVGRSTFYNHYRDKEDLLESSIRDVLEDGKARRRSGGVADRILGRTLHLFEHVERHRIAAAGTSDAERHAVVHEHLEEELVSVLTRDLESELPDRQEAGHPVPLGLRARFMATSVLVVLEWWLEVNPSLSATEANHLLATLIYQTLRH